MTRKIFKKIIHFLKHGEPVTISTILKHNGSTPRTTGSTMITSLNGISHGSVGGGPLEGKVLQTAAKTIAKNQAYIINLNLSSDEIEHTGMICGGKVSILLDPILPSKKNNQFFDLCFNTIKKNTKCSLITIFDINNQTVKKEPQHLLYSNNKAMEIYSLTKHEFKIIEKLLEQDLAFSTATLDNKNKLITCHSISTPETLYILGAGHIAQPTAQIASILGFQVIVMDDRNFFANETRFPDDVEIQIIDFANAFKHVEINKKSYLVIITRGHTYDKVVLKQALATNACYIGMIGSIKKRNSIFNSLKQDGFNEQIIKKTFSPIGIDIGSETPEEIALSIVAEMVSIRTGGPSRCVL